MTSKANKFLLNGVPLLLICGLGLTLRIVYLLQFKETPFFDNLSLDPLFYDRSALSILEGDYLLGNRVLDMGPLYSYFLAGVYSLLGHNLFAARLIQACIGILSCLLIYSIGINVFGKRTALTATIISVLYGPYIFTEANLISESLVIFTNLLLIAMLIEAKERDSLYYWYFSGLLLGISAIIRPNILLFAPLVVIWILNLSKKEGWKRSIFFALCLFLGTITAVAPVTVRNYVIAKDMVLITSSGGLNFYLGNNEKASGILKEPDFIRPDPAYEHEDARKEAERLTGKKLKASESSSFWFHKGLEFIKNNPSKFLKLMKQKLFFLANAYEVPDNLNYDFMKRFSSVLRLPLFHYGIIFPLAVAGLLFSTFKWRKYFLLHLMTASYVIFLLLFFISSRYRLPMVPYLILFASFGLIHFLDLAKEKKGFPLILFLIVLSLTFLYSNKVPEKEKLRFEAQSHDSLGSAYYKENHLNKALEEYEKAASLLPGDPGISNNLAWAYTKKRINMDKAKALAQFAVKSKPQNTSYLDTLAFVYFRLGMVRESRSLINRALALEPNNVELRLRLEKLRNGQFL